MPPVTVHLPAGPATPDSPVFLDAAEPLVLATAFLPWQSYPADGANHGARKPAVVAHDPLVDQEILAFLASR